MYQSDEWLFLLQTIDMTNFCQAVCDKNTWVVDITVTEETSVV